MRVRVNFTLQVYDNRGAVMGFVQVQDQTFCRDFFARVDKGLVLEKEKL